MMRHVSQALLFSVTAVSALLGAQGRVAEAQTWVPPVGVPAPPFGITQVAGSHTHYVDNTNPSATDSGNPNGSVSLPRRTIPTTLAAGSVVEVHGGPYTYSSDSNWTVSGKAATPVFIRGVGLPTLKTDGSLLSLAVSGSYSLVEGFVFDRFQISLEGNYLALRSSEVKNYTPATNSAAITGSGANLVVLSNHIHNNGNATGSDEIDIHGIKFGSGSSKIWIVDNVIHENGGDEIQLGDSNSVEPWVHHVYIGRNTGYGSRENCVDIKRARDVIVSGNDCSGYKPTSSSSGETIVVHNAPERVWILNNKIHDSALGVVTSSNESSPIYVVGNVFYRIKHPTGSSYDPASWWASGHAVQSWTTGDIHIVNNTMQDVDAGIAFPGGEAATVTIAGNVIGKLLQSSHHIGLESSAADMSTVTNTLMLAPSRIKWGSSQVYTVASFKSSHPTQCAGCTDADPLFTDAANYDLSLKAGSPAIDSADADAVYATFQGLYGISIACDISGTLRPQGDAWDMGAYESGSGPAKPRLSITNVSVVEGNP
jgi:hypothetical protein